MPGTRSAVPRRKRRARVAGPAEAEHEGGATTAGQPWRSRYAYRKSQIHFYRLHNPLLSRVLLRLFLWANFRFLAWRGALTPETDPPRESFFALLKEKTP